MKDVYNNFQLLGKDSWTVIIGAFSVSTAKYMVIPFIAIYLVSYMHFTVGEAGIAVAARLWGQRGLTIIAGPLVDFLGSKQTMLIGLLLMGISYYAIAFSFSLILIIFWILISGLGGSCYTVATKSVLTNGITYQQKVFVFSIRTTALSLGGAIGPFLGTLVFFIQPKYLFIVTAITMLPLMIATYLLLDSSSYLAKSNSSSNLVNENNKINSLMRNKLFYKIMFFTIIFYIFYIQIEVTYPLFAKANFYNSTISIMFLINAIVTTFSQILLSIFISKSSLKNIFMIGMSFISASFFLTFFSSTQQIIFFTAIMIFSYGEILILPKLDSELTTCVSSKLLGTAFGIAGLASAVGAGIGGSLGGKIYNNLSANYWLILGCIIGIIIGFIYAAKFMSGGKYATN